MFCEWNTAGQRVPSYAFSQSSPDELTPVRAIHKSRQWTLIYSLIRAELSVQGQFDGTGGWRTDELGINLGEAAHGRLIPLNAQHLPQAVTQLKNLR